MRPSTSSPVRREGFGPNFRPNMPQIRFKNKSFQKMKNRPQAFTQAITKHKKGRNQTIHAFCGAYEGFGPKFRPKIPQI